MHHFEHFADSLPQGRKKKLPLVESATPIVAPSFTSGGPGTNRIEQHETRLRQHGRERPVGNAPWLWNAEHVVRSLELFKGLLIWLSVSTCFCSITGL